MDRKIYRQTYHLEDEDSASSEEIEYIPGAPDMTKEDIERIVATFGANRKPKTSLQVVEIPAEDADESKEDKNIYKKPYRTISAPSWLKDVYDDNDDDDDDDDDDDEDTNEGAEDENEEPHIKTVRYKTTYRTYPEQQSSSEVSYDEDTNEERNDTNEEPNVKTVTYKTTYRTSREQQPSPEASYDEDRNEISEDTNEEPESKEIKYKTTYKMTSEDMSSLYGPFVDDDNDEDWEPEAKRPKGRFRSLFNPSKEKQSFSDVFGIDRSEVPKAIIKRNKKTNRASVVELQPFPGAKYIEVPIPNNTQRFKQTYREQWEADPSLKGWLQPANDDPMYAYCKYCRCKLSAHKKSLKDHAASKKHQRNTYEVTGIWTGSNPKPPNLTYLIPRARDRRDEMSQEAETSPILNMRVVNDPLLPIS